MAVDAPHRALPLPAITYGMLNTISAVAIVLTNKVVLSVYGFKFPVVLTWIHSIVTALGMVGLAACGVFAVQQLPIARTAPISFGYVAFIVFNNLSIKVNTVGFYQLSKILITPCVVVIERLAYGKVLSRQQGWAVALLMLGIAVATVTDTQVTSNPLGILVAAAAVLSSALYQCWAGAKQRELLVNGNQLLHQAMPLAVALLTLLAPLMEPLGLDNIGAPGTVLGYAFTPAAVAWIALSSVLGLAVTLSAFLFIGASSPITYNVVGHCRTVIIVGSGVAFFGEELGLKKACGVLCAVAGIVWYSVAPQGSALCADGGKAGSRAAAKPLLPAASEAPKDTKDCDQGSKV